MESLAEIPAFQVLAELGWIDRLVLGFVVLACLRGLWIGLLREAFSITALAAAFVAVRLWTDPAAVWILDYAPFGIELTARGARLAGGVTVGLAALLTVALVGRIVAASLQAAGLGFFDRIAGGALGVAEGALLAGVALLGLIAIVGPRHEVLAGSRSVELLARARGLAGNAPPDVAAPPPAELSEDPDAEVTEELSL